MLISSKDLPLRETFIQGIESFCVGEERAGNLVICGGIPEALRQDYLNQSLPFPDRAISHISISPDDWREELLGACAEVAGEAVGAQSIGETGVYYLWRAGLGFLPGFCRFGVENHFHFGLRRNEKNPDQTDNIYLPLSEILLGDTLSRYIIADIMLATGGSVHTFIQLLMQMGVKVNQITLACLIAAPEGVYNLLNEYPGLKIVTGELDNHLDGSGYIVPGLGDAGDKFFCGLSVDFFKPFKHLFNEYQWHLLHKKIEEANQVEV